MKSLFWQRIDVLARSLTPFVITLILVVLGQVPMHIPGFAEVAPILPLMAVYHWAIHRPDLLPAVGVFFTGLIQDALSGMPFGVNAAVFVVVHMVVVSQQIFFQGKSFMIIWVGFAMVGAGAVAMIWILNALVFAAMASVEAAFFQYVVTVGVFPILALMLVRWQRTVLAQI